MKNYIKILLLGIFAIASCAKEEIPYVVGSKITMNETDFILAVDSTFTLTATILPLDATDTTILWNSTKETVAVVDENGLVTAVGCGTAYIVATNPASSLMAACMVTVVKTAPKPLDKLENEDSEGYDMDDMEWISPEDLLNDPSLGEPDTPSDEPSDTPDTPSDEPSDTPSDEPENPSGGEQDQPSDDSHINGGGNEDFNMGDIEWDAPEESDNGVNDDEVTPDDTEDSNNQNNL